MIRAGLAAVLLLAVTTAAAAGDRLDATVQLEVEPGANYQSREMLKELEKALLVQLEDRGCFAHVLPSEPVGDPAAPDLRLSVLVDEYSENSEWNVSVARLSDPDQPDASNQVTALADLSFRAALSLIENDAIVRQRDMRIRGSHRPLIGEDPRVEARRQTVLETAQAIRRMVCKGGARKLQKRIDAAR